MNLDNGNRSYRILTAAVVMGLVCLVGVLLPATGAADEANVYVWSKPEAAKVFVNGYFKGFTPCDVSIFSATADIQQYGFTIMAPGYEKWNMDVSLTAGSNKRIDAYLKRLPSAVAGQTICIDPGHPSETSPGCTGPSGVSENHINWVIAKKLQQRLLAQGSTVVLTKPAENTKVTNRQRAETANENNSAVMIRLHCDAASRSGFSLYYPDRQGTRYGVTGPSQSVIDASRTAAYALHRGMKSVLSGTLPDRGVHGDSATYIGSRQGALTGSIFSHVPAVTIEMCVLTVASDERFISSAAGQETMVNALLSGLEEYFRQRGNAGSG